MSRKTLRNTPDRRDPFALQDRKNRARLRHAQRMKRAQEERTNPSEPLPFLNRHTERGWLKRLRHDFA